MIRRALVALVLILSVASPAAACDPDWEDCWWWEEPVWYPGPVWYPEPVPADVWWWQEPAWAPVPEPPPAPEPVRQPAPAPEPVVPPGLYLVTEVYVTDVVSVSGPLTTYSTATVSETPGTYARVIDTVTTGTGSVYDGSAFNGRAALDDGRGVAGTYYENFVLSGGTFVPVSVVFFQDDSALARSAPQPVPPPVSTPPPSSTTTSPAAPLPEPTRPPVPPAAPPPTGAEIARVDPIVELPAGPAPLTPDVPAASHTPVIRPGVSTSPLGEPRAEIEVLRGRAIPLWLRAVVDGVAYPVASWRIAGGPHVVLGPTSGEGAEAFRARWDVVTPAGSAWTLEIDVTVVIGDVPYRTPGEVRVVVRSPALVR